MANNGEIRFGIGFDVNKSGINDAIKELQQLQKLTEADLKIADPGSLSIKEDLKDIKDYARQVEDALQDAFNPRLGIIDFTKFNKSLKDANLDLELLKNAFSLAGTNGQKAFNTLQSTITSANNRLNKTQTILDKIGKTLGNTLRWQLSSSIINKMTGSIQEAYGYVKHLDTALNDIRIVTQKSADEMDKFAQKANAAAQSLGKSTNDYVEASLLYYQQGLGNDEVAARTDTTLKAANVTGQSSSEVAEQLTSVWNGFQVSAQDTEKSVDILAAVAATSASNLEELSTAMSKVASAANMMGVSQEQLTAMLSTVISVTREAPETVGQAFKTIFARVTDIEEGLDDEFASLGNYSGKLAAYGVNVLDINGDLRDMGEVIEEIGGNWADLTREQQISIAQTMAGQRQYSKLIALFDNWDQYSQAINTAENSTGTLQQQQDIYMESTAAHLEQMNAALENIYDSFLDTDTIETFADAIKNVANVFAGFLDSIGGGETLLLHLGSILGKVFGNQLSTQITGIVQRVQDFYTILKSNQHQFDMINEQEGLSEFDKKINQIKQYINENKNLISDDEVRNIEEVLNKIPEKEAELEAVKEAIRAIKDITGKTTFNVEKFESGNVNNFKKHAEEAKEELEQVKFQLDAIAGPALKQLKSSLKDTYKTFEKTESYTKYYEEMDDKVNKLHKSITALKKTQADEKGIRDAGFGTTFYSEVDAAFEKYNEILNANRGGNGTQGTGAAGIKYVEQAADELIKSIAKSAKEAGASVDDLLKHLEGLSPEIIQQIEKEIKNAKEESNKLFDVVKLQNFVKASINVISSIGQLTAGFQTLANIKKIWDNDELSNIEKFTQTLTALTMGLSQVVSGVKVLDEALKVSKTVTSAIAIFKKTYIAALEESAVANTADAAATAVNTGAKTADTVATWNLKVAIEALKASIASIPVIGWIAAAGVAIAGLIVLVTSLVETQEEYSKRLQEDAEKLEEQFNTIKEANDQFKDSLTGYSDAVDGLENLTEGTDEYREAVEKANEQARELLKNNEALAKSATINAETGLIEISDEALKEAEKENQTTLENARTANYAGQRNVLENQLNNFSVSSLIGHEDSLKLLEAIKANGGRTDEEGLRQAVETSGIKVTEYDIGDNGNLIAVQKSTDQIVNLLKDDIDNKVNEYENLIAQNDFIEKDYINQRLANDIDLEEVTAKEREYFQNTLTDIVNSDEYNQKVAEQAKAYENLTTDILKQKYSEKTGIKVEEVSLKKDELVSILSRMDTLNESYDEIKNNALNFGEGMGTLQQSFQQEGFANDIQNFAASKGETGFGLALTPEERERLKEQLDQALINGTFDNYADYFKKLGFDSAEDFIKAYKEAIDNADFTDNFEQVYKAALESKEKILEAKEMLSDKDSLEDLKDEELSLLNILEDKYPELAEARLEGLDAYLAKLDEVQEKEEYNINKTADEWRDEARQQLDKTIDVEVSIDDEDYYDKLSNIVESMTDFVNADWGVDVSIIGDIETDVNSLVNQMNDLAESAALVGEGYKIAADDVETLASKFPELVVASYEANGLLQDGSLQTSREIVDNTMFAADAEIQVGKEAAISRIDDEYMVLDAKQKIAETTLQTMTATYNALKDGEIDADTAIAKSKKDLAQYQTDMDDIKAQNSNSLVELETSNAQTTDEEFNNMYSSISSNAISSFGTMDKASSSFFNNISQNIGNGSVEFNKFLSGQKANSFAVASGIDATAYTGGTKASTQTPSAADLNKQFRDYEAQTAEEKKLAAEAALETQIQTLKNQINAFEGGKAQLIALKSKLLAAENNLSSIRKNMGTGSGNSSSGGSESAKEAEILDYLEEEIDRYHDIDIEIQNINKDLSRLEKQQKKLTGKDLINNLNKQLEILEKQIDAYQRKINIAQIEATENRVALSQMGVKFDENNQISNYAEAFQAALKKYNDAIAEYNSMSAEQQESAGKVAVDLAEKEFEQFKEKLERYEELINDVIPDLEDSIQDSVDKQIELNIEKFKMEIEVRLDMADAERSWNEFKKKVIDGIKDDDYLGIIKSQYSDLLSYFNTAGTGKGPIQALTEQLNGTLDQLKSMDGTLGNWATSYGDNQAAALEDLQTYLDELMNQMMDVEDLVKDIEDTYLDMIDAIKDAFEEQLDNYELIDDIIEHNKNVIELLYGEDAYDQMAQYYDKQEQNNLQQLDFLRQEADFWKQKMDAEEQGSEAWKQYKENWQDALGNLNDQIENSIETLIDKYTNLIDSIFDKLNNKISGGLGLDYLSTEWDLINKNADEYLDTINRAFETQKLQEKFNEALANNTGLKAQQQIKNLMDQQLGDLEQREKLTQYDVERAEKLLDIELKKIALQDAQQNKSKMRLRRDAQGNYSYQFVSDEQKIADAQKELAEAQNSLYNFDKDRYQQNLNEIYDTYNEFQEKLKELYANTALSDEERERQKTLLIQQYGELINAKTEQNAQIRLNLEQSAFNELAKMYNTNIDEFNAMTEEQRNALMEGLIPYWNSGIQEMVNTFAGEGGFIPVCSESFKDLEEATKDYVDSLNEIEAAAGVNFDSIAQGYDKNIELAQELIVKNDELISQYERELSAVQDVLSAVRDLATEYAAVKKNAIEASEAAMKYAQEEAKRKAEAAEEERKKLEAANQSTNNSSSSGSTATKPSTSTSTTSSSSNKKINSINDVKVGDKLKFVSGRYYYTSYGAQPSGDYNLGREVSVVYKNPGAPYPVALHGTGNTPWDLGWVKLDQLEKLKTGGYTGDFGNEGRIGVLHEKELVLNSNDTENMLSAISVLRGLSDVLGAKTLMNLSNALDKIKVNSNIKNNNSEDVCEQQVTITANFPNVNSSNEIEEAINNLINTAAQRRNRRGR